MFFARHLGFQSFRVHSMDNCTWRFEFYNSSKKHIKSAGIVKVFNDEVNLIRFSHKPTCKDIVSKMLVLAKNGERIDSLTNRYNTMTLMRPFTTIEELLVKIDLELSYEQ